MKNAKSLKLLKHTHKNLYLNYYSLASEKYNYLIYFAGLYRILIELTTISNFI